MAEQRQELTEAEARRARQVRRAGYIVFGGTALWLSVALVNSVLGGISAGDIADPFTGQPYVVQQADCERWARSLALSEQAVEGEAASQWQLEVESWMTRCARHAPDEARYLGGRRVLSIAPR